MNNVNFIGRLGKDPSLATTEGGVPYTKFSLALNSFYKDKKGEKQEKTDWVNCVAFGTLSEIVVKNLAKGRKISFEGRVDTSSYEKDGATQFSTNFIAQKIGFLDAKASDGETEAQTDTPEHF